MSDHQSLFQRLSCATVPPIACCSWRGCSRKGIGALVHKYTSTKVHKCKSTITRTDASANTKTSVRPSKCMFSCLMVGGGKKAAAQTMWTNKHALYNILSTNSYLISEKFVPLIFFSGKVQSMFRLIRNVNI